MKCAVFVMNENAEPQLAGTFKLSHDQIKCNPAKGCKVMMQDILGTPNMIDGAPVDAASDPKTWFGGLPSNYCGTYVRAQMLPKKKKS